MPCVVVQVLAAMDAHPLSIAVQEQCCGFLWSLLSVEDTRTALPPATVAAVLTRLLRAMQLHVGNASVQEAACAALCNLLSCAGVTMVAHTSRPTSPLSSRTLSDSPSRPMLLPDAGDSEADVDSDVVGVALSLGAMARVVQCMDVHKDNAGVQEKACLLLWSLLSPVDDESACHPLGKTTASDSGVIGRVVSARQRFNGQQGVEAAVDGVLALLLATA